jgi:hypothetical protein
MDTIMISIEDKPLFLQWINVLVTASHQHISSAQHRISSISTSNLGGVQDLSDINEEATNMTSGLHDQDDASNF